MMDKLQAIVKAAVATELAEARKNNGDYFHSPHEGYGVLCEELFEASIEAELLDGSKDTLMYDLHADDAGIMTDTLEMIEKHAALAACEYIQVGAMARKMRESLEVGKR